MINTAESHQFRRITNTQARMKARLSSPGNALTITLPSRTYRGGDTVTGSVEMNYPIALQEGIEGLRIKFRGMAVSQIVKRDREGTSTYTTVVFIAKNDTVLWKKEKRAYPTPDSHMMSFPFEIILPPDIPGSFHVEQYENSATVSYGVEVIADRPGFLRFNRRLGRILRVMSPPLSAPSEDIVTNITRIPTIWKNEPRLLDRSSKQIRKSFWGPYSEVSAELRFPNTEGSRQLRSLPVGTIIPVSLTVVTTTKPMGKGDVPPDELSPTSLKPAFPAPPTSPGEITCELVISAAITAQHAKRSVRSVVTPLGGFGPSALASTQDQIIVTHDDPDYIIDTEHTGKGRWRRKTRFETTIELPVTCLTIPKLPHMNCEYQLHVKVPFPGRGNDIDFVYTIDLNSGSLPDFDPNVPPPDLDHLPAYFRGEYHKWDAEEKS